MLGSLCVQINSIIVMRRKAFAKSKLLRFLEVSVFAIAMALIAFATASMWGSCTSKPTNIQDWTAVSIASNLCAVVSQVLTLCSVGVFRTARATAD